MEPVEVTKKHARRHWPLYFLATVAALSFSPVMWVAGIVYGPAIEGPSIASMEVVFWRCDRHDLIVELEVVKRHGSFRGLTVEAVGTEGIRPLRWRPISPDFGPHRMTAGLPARAEGQTVGPMMVEFGCGRPLTVHTRHGSDRGWWAIESDFGPFGPYGDPPEVTIQDLMQGRYPPPVQQTVPVGK